MGLQFLPIPVYFWYIFTSEVFVPAERPGDSYQGNLSLDSPECSFHLPGCTNFLKILLNVAASGLPLLGLANTLRKRVAPNVELPPVNSFVFLDLNLIFFSLLATSQMLSN